MPQYEIVYFELTRLTKSIEAPDLDAAIIIGENGRHEPFWWDDVEEETLGTMGVEAVYLDGKLVYDAGIRNPDTGDPIWSEEPPA